MKQELHLPDARDKPERVCIRRKGSGLIGPLSRPLAPASTFALCMGTSVLLD
jgi:hypothetical protein